MVVNCPSGKMVRFSILKVKQGSMAAESQIKWRGHSIITLSPKRFRAMIWLKLFCIPLADFVEAFDIMKSRHAGRILTLSLSRG